jgi:hypothetical protein
MPAEIATYQPQASGMFPTAFLLLVLILTAIGVIAHAAFV